MTHQINRDVLRKRITDRRGQLGLNQAQLAERAGVTPAAISQIESGDRTPTIPVLQRIASVLAVSMDFLIGRKDSSELEDLLHNEEIQSFYRGFQALKGTDRDQIMKHMELLKQLSTQGKKK